MLVAGDKAGKWEAWYRQAIPLAEQRYAHDIHFGVNRATDDGERSPRIGRVGSRSPAAAADTALRDRWQGSQAARRSGT